MAAVSEATHDVATPPPAARRGRGKRTTADVSTVLALLRVCLFANVALTVHTSVCVGSRHLQCPCISHHAYCAVLLCLSV